MAIESFIEKAGHHPVVVALPDDTYFSLLKIARQTGNKNDLCPIVMKAIERYIDAQTGG